MPPPAGRPTLRVISVFIACATSSAIAEPTIWDQSTDFWSNPARWSGGIVINLLDFALFLNMFNAGCP